MLLNGGNRDDASTVVTLLLLVINRWMRQQVGGSLKFSRDCQA